MTGNQFRKRFAPLLNDLDREETVEAYNGLTPTRQREIERKLRRVGAFRNALRSEIGPSASVSARLVDLGITKKLGVFKRPSHRLTLSASADQGEDHPFKVDEAVAKAVRKSNLGDDFHIVGTGGGCNGWARQTDFWEGATGRPR